MPRRVAGAAIGGMESTCPKCDGRMAAGVTSALGLMGRGRRRRRSRVRAFAQGLAEEPADEGYLVPGYRCTRCGFLELYATERTIPPGT